MADFVLANRNEYSHVAEVSSNSLEDAILLTTHRDQNWWDNENVHEDERIGLIDNARSTKIGDVLVMNSQAYVVAMNNELSSLPGRYSLYEIAR